MKTKTLVFVLLWFAGIFAAAHAGVFINIPGKPPGALGIAFGGPLLLFALTFTTSARFRETISNLSPIFLAALHGWRFVGLGFIAMYYRDLLPPGFAFPAGLGDIAVAALAPYVVYWLATDKAFLESNAFLAWNIFGVVDLLAAVGLGVAHQISPQFFHAPVATGVMQELPYALIPCFFVPLLGMSHIAMVYQAARQRNRAHPLPHAQFSTNS